ncbi:MAG TPA: lipid-A-disaccharide synthase [Gemmatimonadales bacterium]|nr:lipid-A-disaccharide synthase [Gemmatimonadales bacterium]
MSAGPVRIFVSAGEPSGDLHGAGVVQALRDRFPGAEIDAFGGAAMAAAGARVLYPMEEYSAMGFIEVIESIPKHLRLLRTLRRRFERERYDLVLLIDYPGFHLRLAGRAHRSGAKVLYYIAPQLWAWRPGRVKHLRGVVDRVAAILPFEERAFGALGLITEYVGHPLVDHAPGPGHREAARKRLGLPAEARVLAIFPGSRTNEIGSHWQRFRDAGLQVLEEGRCDRVLLAATPSGEYPEPGPIAIHRGDSMTVLSAADAVLAKSGTTTLQAALAGTPMVVAYRTHPWTYRIARHLMTVPWISLVNLIAEREVVPELTQHDVTVSNLADAIRPLLDPADPRTRAQHEGLALVRQRLGSPGASGRVAEIAAELIGR